MGDRELPPVRSRRWMAAAKCLQVDQWTEEVIRAFQVADLRTILLKGPVVARWLYADDLPARQYVDVDILVSPAELDRARHVLSQLGFARRSVELLDELQAHAEQWDRESDGAAVDLHRTLHGCEALSNEVVWAELSQRTEPLQVGKVVVDIPRLAVRTMHVVLHLRANDAPGSQTWSDLDRAMAQLDLNTWREAAQLATRLGVEGEMGAKLSMRDGALAADLGLTAPAPLRLLLLRQGAGALAVGQLTELQGLASKARYCFQMLFPPRSYLIQSSPEAKRGPVGLAGARVVRVTSCVLRLPGSVTGWRRARAEHRQQT